LYILYQLKSGSTSRSDQNFVLSHRTNRRGERKREKRRKARKKKAHLVLDMNRPRSGTQHLNAWKRYRERRRSSIRRAMAGRRG
jgi:hypothetical protein